MRGDHSGALRAFRTIAAAGSFTAAARDLAVTPSALSQTLRQLEERLGVRLLQRTTRKVGLTEAGRQLLEDIAPALGALDAAVEAVRQHGERPAGLLRLTVPQAAVDALLAPTLPAFRERYPQITLDIEVSNRLTDLIAAGIDAGIRLGEMLDPGMVAVPLGPAQRSRIVGSPGYFARHGRPKQPRDLARHDCIQFRFAPGGAVYRWEFAHNGRWSEMTTAGTLMLNDVGLALHAARDGLGLYYALEPHVRADIAAGRLEPVLDGFLPPFDGFHLYYPSRRQMPLKLRVFIDVLRAQAAARAPRVRTAATAERRPSRR